MAVPTAGVMSPTISDPVTKAVVDNIMGNLPTKKPHVRCNDCDISFTSQTVLDAHLQGARHAKQIKSQAIMTSLEDTKVAFTKDQETNGLKCNVCDVSLNSIQQLQTHLNGNRHKKKAMKGEWGGVEDTQVSPAPKKSSDSASTPAPMKSHFFSCDTCNKMFNSQGQYDQHLASKKHSDKVNGAGNQRNKRFFPYRKNSGATSNREDYTQSLTNNFIPGGYQNYR